MQNLQTDTASVCTVSAATMRKMLTLKGVNVNHHTPIQIVHSVQQAEGHLDLLFSKNAQYERDGLNISYYSHKTKRMIRQSFFLAEPTEC